MEKTSNKWTIYRLGVDSDQDGTRLDQFLPNAAADVSRSLVRKVIDLGGVHVNGRRTRTCGQKVSVGDQVDMYLDHLPLPAYRINSEDVVYQDKYLIVLNKPAMVETQPTHARYKGTLYEALQLYLTDPFRPRHKPAVGMIQRLDRSTSGLIVFSIHPEAHKKMTQMFVGGAVEKTYLALVHGQPEPVSGEITSLLARSRRENRVHSVAVGGKQAITRYRIETLLHEQALVRVQILTGRSHQIRAHMTELGCPLLGDQRYGGPLTIDSLKVPRVMLHAHQLKFAHPVTEHPLDFSLPMPEDMTKVVDFLERR